MRFLFGLMLIPFAAFGYDLGAERLTRQFRPPVAFDPRCYDEKDFRGESLPPEEVTELNQLCAIRIEIYKRVAWFRGRNVNSLPLNQSLSLVLQRRMKNGPDNPVRNVFNGFPTIILEEYMKREGKTRLTLNGQVAYESMKPVSLDDPGEIANQAFFNFQKGPLLRALADPHSNQIAIGVFFNRATRRVTVTLLNAQALEILAR